MENVDDNRILPGARVKVFDPRLFVNDIKTPLSYTVKPATVICRYGCVSEWMEKEYGKGMGRYPDLVDVIFDWNGKISKGHFTSGVTYINE